MGCWRDTKSEKETNGRGSRTGESCADPSPLRQCVLEEGERPITTELVVSIPPPTQRLSTSLLCTGLLLTDLPMETYSNNPGPNTVEPPSSPLSDTGNEEGFDFSHKVRKCTDSQAQRKPDPCHLELCTGMKLVTLPDRTGPKTRAGWSCKDSGLADIVCSGPVYLPTPGSTSPHEKHPAEEDPSSSDEDPSSGSPSWRDSQTSNDSGILLRGLQYSQEQGQPRRSTNTSTTHTLPPPQKKRISRQEISCTAARKSREELVMAGCSGGNGLRETSTNKVVVVAQRPLEVVELCPNDEMVMAVSLPIPRPRTGQKIERLGIDRRHSDIRLFTCNMPASH